ncbi:FecR domain-containing protein [Dinghuibacter silviterrae]|uniref:FecR family protein n=1 Tax=Dinghuibacter silviterrae TaxID=1539049 RepID=A0A4R8DF96_9BACT|nr:FecR domain-containing protein [Dinghuibacter silviterrae]TDW96251.1 FecR family protein [Dinghuibacter silviterrae]
MDSRDTYNDFPWELIVSALEGSLTPEDELRFSQWLASSEANREKYRELSRLWKEGVTDYPVYAAADEVQAWEALQGKMPRTIPADRTITAGRVLPVGRWLAVAALLIVAVGAGWWYFAGKGTYQTAAGEHKDITLPDGSSVVLQPRTRLEQVNARTVRLVSGEARFMVIHHAEQPFKVDMDAAIVEDIGTTFTIDKTADSIAVTVSSGKIAFFQKKTGETRDIGEGGHFCLYTNPLRFDNAPLSQVLAALEQRTGRTIRMDDTSYLQKKLTVNLEGETLANALQVICVSLNLDYTEKDGVIILSPKK